MPFITRGLICTTGPRHSFLLLITLMRYNLKKRFPSDLLEDSHCLCVAQLTAYSVPAHAIKWTRNTGVIFQVCAGVQYRSILSWLPQNQSSIPAESRSSLSNDRSDCVKTTRVSCMTIIGPYGNHMPAAEVVVIDVMGHELSLPPP